MNNNILDKSNDLKKHYAKINYNEQDNNKINKKNED